MSLSKTKELTSDTSANHVTIPNNPDGVEVINIQYCVR